MDSQDKIKDCNGGETSAQHRKGIRALTIFRTDFLLVSVEPYSEHTRIRFVLLPFHLYPIHGLFAGVASHSHTQTPSRSFPLLLRAYPFKVCAFPRVSPFLSFFSLSLCSHTATSISNLVQSKAPALAISLVGFSAFHSPTPTSYFLLTSSLSSLHHSSTFLTHP
jgi:hypothetical protein